MSLQGAGRELWQWLREILPGPVKRWVRRSILRRASDVWQVPTPAQWTPHPVLTEQDRLAAPDTSRVPVVTAYDVIIFSSADWSHRFQRPQQLARQFAAAGHRVWYVDTSLEPGRSGTGEPPSPMFAAVQPGICRVRVESPSRLNVYRDRFDDAALERAAAAFEALRDGQAIADAVCLVQLPFWRPLSMRLRDRFGWKVVYDCLDRHNAFSTNSAAVIAEEEPLIHSSDVVTATSRVLFEDIQIRNPRSLLLPNAADFGHFRVSSGEIPASLERLPRPIIGYVGAVADWFDSALIGRLARLRPAWSIILVGSTFSADLRPLKGLPNVHLLGEQPYEALPAYLRAFDACIIPFKKSPLTEATNPVKFYEYLSAGKPVVSVPLPELRAHVSQGLVYLYDQPEDFVLQIERALGEDSADRVRTRREFARDNTWQARYARLDRAIRTAHPMASITIPTHGNLPLLQLCLDGIFRNTSWPNYEIIVVDNASSDGTPRYLRDLAARYPNVRCIFNTRNEGFARATNQGLAAAAGEYLILLNDDTIVTRGWLGTMIGHLERHADVGMVGPVTNLAGNEAKIDVEYQDIDQMERFAADYTRAHAGHAREIPALGFFCAVVPRRVLSRIGLLDERFGVGMFEDDDLSHRVRLAGYRLLCVDDAFVHHFHSATFRRLGEREHQRLFDENRAKFERKWSTRWTPHRYRDPREPVQMRR